jgi:hypothetical protein
VSLDRQARSLARCLGCHCMCNMRATWRCKCLWKLDENSEVRDWQSAVTAWIRRNRRWPTRSRRWLLGEGQRWPRSGPIRAHRPNDRGPPPAPGKIAVDSLSTNPSTFAARFRNLSRYKSVLAGALWDRPGCLISERMKQKPEPCDAQLKAWVPRSLFDKVETAAASEGRSMASRRILQGWAAEHDDRSGAAA